MRIITGKAKGKVLIAPAGLETRPTLDRVKEALFGSIQFDLEGADVLDLFSGSGNIGLEAASRGARTAVLNRRIALNTVFIRQIGTNPMNRNRIRNIVALVLILMLCAGLLIGCAPKEDPGKSGQGRY